MAQFISASELARRLSVAKATIYNWVWLRRIPFIKVGRALRFDPEEVEQIVKHVPKEPQQ